MKIRLVGVEMFLADGQTDATKVVVALRNFTNALKNCTLQYTLFCFFFLKRHDSLTLNFRRRIKSRLPFAGIIRRSPYSTRFQDKGRIEIV